jgi:hypothetical protein
MRSFEADHFPHGWDDNITGNFERGNDVKASVGIAVLVISKRASITHKLVHNFMSFEVPYKDTPR